MTTDDFTALPDLASRALVGSVSAANDELFAHGKISSGPKLRSSTRTSSVTRERSTTGGNPSPPRQRS